MPDPRRAISAAVLVGALLCLPGCRGTLTVDGFTPGESDDDDATADPNDLDGDGDPADTDCDDEDPSAFTGNDEVCGDGVDNDCDPATLCYEASAGGDSQFILPVTNGTSAEQWYRSGSDGAPPFMASDRLSVALHQQQDSRDLSLVFVVDAIEDGSGGRAEVFVQGVAGASLLIQDDPGEGFVDGDEAIFDFEWVQCCVDGAVIGPLAPDLCISIDVEQADNLDGFDVVSRDAQQALGPSDETFTLCATN